MNIVKNFKKYTKDVTNGYVCVEEYHVIKIIFA